MSLEFTWCSVISTRNIPYQFITLQKVHASFCIFNKIIEDLPKQESIIEKVVLNLLTVKC